VHITVQFFSYLKDLTGCAQVKEELPAGSTVADLLRKIFVRFPQLEPMSKSFLVSVGVEYKDRQHRLSDGDEISLFPPVQGG